MIKQAKLITLFNDLLEHQRYFQIALNNKVPENGIVTFDNVQTSIQQNVYQSIEFQEFMEASLKDREEELIDYLLFMINKYLYLMDISFIQQKGDSSLNGILWSNNDIQSIANCASLAKLEQDFYITLLRKYCTFKPWKVYSVDQNCADPTYVYGIFMLAVNQFRQMANIVYHTYDEFYDALIGKITKNIDRQNNGY